MDSANVVVEREGNPSWLYLIAPLIPAMALIMCGCGPVEVELGETYDPQAQPYLSTLHLSNPGGPTPVFKEQTVALLW